MDRIIDLVKKSNKILQKLDDKNHAEIDSLGQTTLNQAMKIWTEEMPDELKEKDQEGLDVLEYYLDKHAEFNKKVDKILK